MLEEGKEKLDDQIASLFKKLQEIVKDQQEIKKEKICLMNLKMQTTQLNFVKRY